MKNIIEKKVKEIINENSYETSIIKKSELFVFIDNVKLNLSGVYCINKAKNNFKDDINYFIMNYEILFHNSDVFNNKIKQFEELLVK